MVPPASRFAALALTLALALLLASSFSVVRADYGRKENDLGPPAPTLPNPESIRDDAKVVADDNALRKVEDERNQLAQKLSDIDKLRLRVNTKHELLRRVSQLKLDIDQRTDQHNTVIGEEKRAAEQFELSQKRMNDSMDEKERIVAERKKIETLLLEIQHEKMTIEQEIAQADAAQKKSGARQEELQLERDRLLKHVETLAARFRSDGFHNWLEGNVHSLPPIMRETIMKTSEFVDPFIGRVEEAASFNEQLTNETTEAITRYLPAIRNSPFYNGLIFYLILLVPIVTTTWLVLKIRARLSLLTVEHYLVALNLYFGVLSVACAVMTIMGKTDILIVFRHRSLRMSEIFMILHGFLFVLHLVLHGMTAYVSGVRKDFAQYICMSCVGLHFFLNAYKRTILDQDPHIGAPAYVVYSAIFLYTLYDRGVYIIEAAVRDRKSDTNAFSTYPSDRAYKLPTTASGDGGDRTVYFAGLPVFNAPAQSAMDDAKTI